MHLEPRIKHTPTASQSHIMSCLCPPKAPSAELPDVEEVEEVIPEDLFSKVRTPYLSCHAVALHFSIHVLFVRIA